MLFEVRAGTMLVGTLRVEEPNGQLFVSTSRKVSAFTSNPQGTLAKVRGYKRLNFKRIH